MLNLTSIHFPSRVILICCHPSISKLPVDVSSHVVRLPVHSTPHSFAETSTTMLLQWELVNGPDLLDLLNLAHSKRLPEPTVAHYFQQLINAVIFMHNNGFCHRDLKAENCVVDRASQRVKVSHLIHTANNHHAAWPISKHESMLLLLLFGMHALLHVRALLVASLFVCCGICCCHTLLPPPLAPLPLCLHQPYILI